MRLMWLLVLLCYRSVLSQELKTDFIMRTTTTTFLPAIEIDENDRVKPSYVHRVYDFRDSIFRVSFNALLCDEFNHTLIISFMHHWIDPEHLPRRLMYNNTFVFKGIGNTSTTEASGETIYPYTLSIMSNGKLNGTSKQSFSVVRAHIYIQIAEKSVWMKRHHGINSSHEDSSVELVLESPLPRYIAVFSTHMQYCPTFIAAVDKNFDLSDEVPVKSRSRTRVKRTKVLRGVVFGCLVIFIYYYCLTSYFLPLYFDVILPCFTKSNLSISSSATESKGSPTPKTERNDKKSSQNASTMNSSSSMDNAKAAI